MSRKAGVKQVSFQTFDECLDEMSRHLYRYIHMCSMCIYVCTISNSLPLQQSHSVVRRTPGSQSVISQFEPEFPFPGYFTTDK